MNQLYQGKMGGERQGHVSERFARLIALYCRPDGSEWGGQDIENATGGALGTTLSEMLAELECGAAIP